MQLRTMQLGGNLNAVSGDIHLYNNCCLTSCIVFSQQNYFKQHDVTTNDIKLKYTSRAAILYKEKLAQQANAAVKSFSGNIHLDSGSNNADGGSKESEEPEKKKSDFFTEIESNHSKQSAPSVAPVIDSAASLFSEPEMIQPQQQFAVPGSTSLSVSTDESQSAPVVKKMSSLGASKKPVSDIDS